MARKQLIPNMRCRRGCGRLAEYELRNSRSEVVARYCDRCIDQAVDYMNDIEAGRVHAGG